VHARISNGQPREDSRGKARVGRVGGQVSEDYRACPARGKLNGEDAGHGDFRALDPRTEVCVGPVEFKLKPTSRAAELQLTIYQLPSNSNAFHILSTREFYFRDRHTNLSVLLNTAVGAGNIDLQFTVACELQHYF